MTVPNQFHQPVGIRQLTQEGKQTSQESASTSKRLRSNQAPVKMLTAMDGPELEYAESSVAIHQACTEFCSSARSQILIR